MYAVGCGDAGYGNVGHNNDVCSGCLMLVVVVMLTITMMYAAGNADAGGCGNVALILMSLVGCGDARVLGPIRE